MVDWSSTGAALSAAGTAGRVFEPTAILAMPDSPKTREGRERERPTQRDTESKKKM